MAGVAADIQWVEVMDVAKHPVMHMTVTITKNDLAQNVSSAEVEKTSSEIIIF